MVFNSRFTNNVRMQYVFQFIGLLATVALQYLWLFGDVSFAFRIWAFTVLPAYYILYVFVFLLLRFSPMQKEDWLLFAGRILLWIQAILYPLIALGAAVAVYYYSGGKMDPDWKWTTLGISAVLDLPLVYLLTLPITAVQVLVWFHPFATPNHAGSFIARISSAVLFWLLANSMFIVLAYQKAGIAYGASTLALFLALGVFLYRMQERGSVLPAAFSLYLAMLAYCLIFGSNIPDLNHLLFGYDVEIVPRLVEIKTDVLIQYQGIIAGVFLLFAAAVRTKSIKN